MARNREPAVDPIIHVDPEAQGKVTDSTLRARSDKKWLHGNKVLSPCEQPGLRPQDGEANVAP